MPRGLGAATSVIAEHALGTKRDVVQPAVEWLGLHYTREAGEVLSELLKQGVRNDVSVQLDALDVLADAGEKGERHASAVLSVLISEQSEQVRGKAASTLLSMGEPGSEQIATLPALLEDPDVRMSATRALSTLGPQLDANTRALVLKASHHQLTEVRVAATFVLGDVGGEDATARVKAILSGDPDMSVRKMAQEALDDIYTRETSKAR